MGSDSTGGEMPQPDMALQDIAALKQLADDPKVPSAIRDAASQGVIILTGLLDDLKEDLGLAEEYGVVAQIEKWSDGRIARYLSDALNSTPENRPNLVQRKATLDVDALFQALGILPNSQFRYLVDLRTRLMSVALAQELTRRQLKNENARGREVRELIVEEDERGELLIKLGTKAARTPSFNGEFPESSEDAQSQAYEVIWARIKGFTTSSPPAADPAFLDAIMTGGLNRVLYDVRDSLWYKRKVDRKEAEILFVADEGQEESANGESARTRSWDRLHLLEPPTPTEQVLHTKILVEKLLSNGSLSEKEENAIELVVKQGWSQEEAAEELKMSQATVCRLCTSALEKLRDQLT